MRRLFIVAILATASISCFAQGATVSVQQSLSQYVQSTTTDADRIPYLTELNTTLGTEGSAMLWNGWCTGRVYLTNGTVLQETDKTLNFDKMKKGLLLKLSEKNVLEVNMAPIQYFILNDGTNDLVFRQLPGKPSEYALELQTGPEYSSYKTISTQFFKADYVNKGLYQSGSRYDRYVDEVKYYIFDKQGKMVEVVKTGKKELKKLGEELPMAKKYLEKNSFDTSDPDKSIKDLTAFINKPMS